MCFWRAFWNLEGKFSNWDFLGRVCHEGCQGGNYFESRVSKMSESQEMNSWEQGSESEVALMLLFILSTKQMGVCLLLGLPATRAYWPLGVSFGIPIPKQPIVSSLLGGSAPGPREQDVRFSPFWPFHGCCSLEPWLPIMLCLLTNHNQSTFPLIVMWVMLLLSLKKDWSLTWKSNASWQENLGSKKAPHLR